jgi:hypothetical protein
VSEEKISDDVEGFEKPSRVTGDHPSASEDEEDHPSASEDEEDDGATPNEEDQEVGDKEEEFDEDRVSVGGEAVTLSSAETLAAVPPAPNAPLCDACEGDPAATYCGECKKNHYYCADCHAAVHGKVKNKDHVPLPIEMHLALVHPQSPPV